jgi:hypothetical protein
MFPKLSLTALLVAGIPAAAVAGPPWVSIELPANPWDQTTRGAFLLVHAFHHGFPIQVPVTGVAEGIVNGQRKTVTLTFEKASRPGVYALRNQWGNAGHWVLVITVSQHQDDVAQAMVEISEAGAVTAVRVPVRAERDGSFPRRVTQAEVEAALRNGKSS